MDLQHVLTAIKSDSKVAEEFKENPSAALEKYALSPLSYDRWIYRAVVVVLSLCGLMTVIGVLVVWGLNWGNPPSTFKVPEVLVALGSASIGALAGLLAPSPK
jgi:hypothetical protein